ncbi:hypothetical protein SC1_01390 [Sphingopyxis sp. C-1]|nr:hypothetical protein SC1_01390 [Sphingopyxis sp. C-1]
MENGRALRARPALAGDASPPASPTRPRACSCRPAGNNRHDPG